MFRETLWIETEAELERAEAWLGTLCDGCEFGSFPLSEGHILIIVSHDDDNASAICEHFFGLR